MSDGDYVTGRKRKQGERRARLVIGAGERCSINSGQQMLPSAGDLQAKPEADTEWSSADTWGSVPRREYSKQVGRLWAMPRGVSAPEQESSVASSE